MCKINCEVVDGLIPSEKVAKITDIHGTVEEVAVAKEQVIGNALLASEIGRTDGKVLVELPRESASGRWRLWVNENQLGA